MDIREKILEVYYRLAGGMAGKADLSDLLAHVGDAESHLSEGDRADLEAAVARASGYVHVQEAPSATWTIQHNLGKYPSVSTYTTSSGSPQRIVGDVDHVDENNVTVTFSMIVSGVAYLN